MEGVRYAKITPEVHEDELFRYPIEMLGRTAIVHAIVIANYMHLQSTQKLQYSSRKLQVLRLTLFALMPSLVYGELAVSLFRTFLLFLRADPTQLTLSKALEHWKRYLCACAGMYAVPQPGIREEGAVEEGTDGGTPAGPVSTARPTRQHEPRLCTIQNSDDLQQHEQPWDMRTIGRLILLVLPILQAVGTIVLYARRSEGNRQLMELDKRNFVAAISSIICSLLSTVIICCRSSWSLNLLNSAQTKGEPILGKFFMEIVIASILNEAPFAWSYNLVPTSWIVTIAAALHPIGIILVSIIALQTWFFVTLYHDKIKQKISINWPFVFGIPVVIITAWIFFDLGVYFILAIAQLTTFGEWVRTGSAWRSGTWNKDPWSVYLPIC